MVIGATTPEITPALDAAGFTDYRLETDFKQAVVAARQSMTRRGGNVLLSPACAKL